MHDWFRKLQDAIGRYLGPVQEIPVQEIPVQEIPVQEIPVQEIPVPETTRPMGPLEPVPGTYTKDIVNLHSVDGKHKWPVFTEAVNTKNGTIRRSIETHPNSERRDTLMNVYGGEYASPYSVGYMPMEQMDRRSWQEINNMFDDEKYKHIIRHQSGGSVPMFQNSGKIDWRNKTGYIEDPYTNQSGLTTQYSYGDVQKDENKFTYRDSRLQYTGPDNSVVQTNYVREYKPNGRYKRYVKKYGYPTQPHMWTNHANDGTMSTDTFGYTPEQIDSLTTYFNTFGSL